MSQFDYNFVGVSAQFLRKDHFLKACQIMLKRRVILKQLIQFITQIYSRWIQFSNRSMKLGSSLQNTSLQWFKSLIDTKMFSIFFKIITFQDTELKSLIQQNKQNHQRSDIIMNSLADYTHTQSTFKSLVLNLRQTIDQQEKAININKETSNEIMNLFSQNQQNTKTKNLQQKLSQINSQLEKGFDLIPSVEKQRNDFVEQCLKFRYLLCENRGNMIKRFKQVCQHTISGFVITFMALKQNIRSTKVHIQNQSVYMMNDNSRSIISISETSFLKVNNDNYKQILSFINYLKEITQLMKKFCSQFSNQIQQVQSLLLNNIISTFHLSQSPHDNVSDLLDTLKNVFSRIQCISQKINTRYKDLQNESKHLQRLNQIAHSISKFTAKNNLIDQKQKSYSQDINLQKRNSDKHNINNDGTKNIQNLNKIVNQIFKIIEQQSQVFMVWIQSKNINLQSMSNISMESMNNISQISSFSISRDQVKQVWIKPVEQLWLWENWKDQQTYKIPYQTIRYLKLTLRKLKDYQNDTSTQPQRTQNCDCLLTNSAGKLQFRSKTIKFVSQNYTGRVAYKDIQKVFVKQVNNRNILCILSNKGLLRFTNLSSQQQIRQFIKLKTQKSSEVKLVSKISKSFNNYQPGFISQDEQKQLDSPQRTQRISNVIPNVIQFTQMFKSTLEDVTLVTFFRECLSDSQLKIKDQTYQNLLFYAYSKICTSIKGTKWNPQPPSYFTGMGTNPITSNLLFSQKLIQYQKNADSQIPNIPLSLNIKNNLKLYWINKQRLILQNHIFHSNYPQINNYTILTLIDIIQNNRCLQVNCYRKVNILKDSKQNPKISQMILNGVQQNVKQYLKSIHQKLSKPLDLVIQQVNKVKPQIINTKSDPQRLLIIIIVIFLSLWLIKKLF